MKRTFAVWIQEIFLGVNVLSRGPISRKFPKPVELPPGPPCSQTTRGAVSRLRESSIPYNHLISKRENSFELFEDVNTRTCVHQDEQFHNLRVQRLRMRTRSYPRIDLGSHLKIGQIPTAQGQEIGTLRTSFYSNECPLKHRNTMKLNVVRFWILSL